MNAKADHVAAAPDPGGHTCHWPGCEKRVKPAMWGCSKHWFTVPIRLRRKIWAAYTVGQEVSKTPSRAYIDAAREVQAWIAEHLAGVKADRQQKELW